MPKDITENYHGGNRESKAAFKRLKREVAEKDMQFIERAAVRQGERGITCDEAERILGMKHQTCSARFSEMVKEKRLIRSDDVRPTRSGCPARVHFKAA